MDEFYFENDHVAFRGDADYNSLLRYLSIRLTERASIRKHIEELTQLKQVYINDPAKFLDKLKSNEPIVPKYFTTKEKLPLVIEKLGYLTENEHATENYAIKRTRQPADEKTADTFNRLWTFEEQRRLEDLLLKYPPEPIEMHRFTKIAKELGNRTALQVSSRVQKYFQKLYSAGLPIPGRIPKNRRIHAKMKNFQRTSTFFPAHHVPVTMPEEEFPSNEEFLPHIKSESLQNLDIKPTLSKVEHSRVLELLKLIRSKCKENRMAPLNPCESCYLLPTNTFHWHCFDCNWRKILCSECMIKKLLSYNFEHILHNVVIDN